MRPVRFVHAADLHLDAPFAGVDASDPRVRAALIAAPAEAFGRIVDLCLAEHVDFLVIAGDIYDNARNFAAQLRFQQETQRLADAGIPVYVAEGNHDPESTRPRDLVLPDTVHYFSARTAERLEFHGEGALACAVYGQGYARAAETANLAAGFKRAGGDPLAVAVLHTNIGGHEGAEDYAPASLEDLRAARMDYWALGHIHKPEVLSASPAIVYAGCPQGRSPKEDGPRGCFLVELDSTGARTEFRVTSSVVWARTVLDASGLANVDELRSALRGVCEDARAAAMGVPTIVRIEIGGRSDVHSTLARGTVLTELERDLCDEQMSRDPWVWVDRLSDRTGATIDLEGIRSSQDFLGDLVRTADDLEADMTALTSVVRGVLDPLESSLGTVDLELTDRELLEQARDACLERLGGDVS